jgi:hypothetical protein
MTISTIVNNDLGVELLSLVIDQSPSEKLNRQSSMRDFLDIPFYTDLDLNSQGPGDFYV